jgi:tetratricopeptide (TPR) repeat protein
LSSLNNLANLYAEQGKFEQAEPLYQRALAIDEKVYGQDHPEVATDLRSLAILYEDQGKFEQAEPLYQRALAIREQVFGSDHPATIRVRKNYSDHLEKMKQKTKAVSAKPKAPRKQGRK